MKDIVFDLVYTVQGRNLPDGKREWRKTSERRVDEIERYVEKAFETQEVRAIGGKEAEKSRGFPILWIEIIGFSDRRKEIQKPGLI